ncbi:hypothetical protein JNM05_13955 [bacterium]|nr:hypothetical protein [bacterium]
MKLRRVNRYTRIAVGGLYAVLGTCIMLLEVLPGNLDPRFYTMMGFVLICYGLYRVVHSLYLKPDGGKQENE